MKLNVVYAGQIDYKEALDIQETLLALCEQDKIEDTLLLLEHPPVLTLGTSADRTHIFLSEQELKNKGVKVYEVNRGGDVTYHGPGQIVGYPIFNLMRHGKDIRKYIFNIQEVFLRLLSNEFGITAHRELKKYAGVYVESNKITAIGVAIIRWISMHGFAFNVNTDLSHFSWINPCGLSDRGVTSLQKLTGTTQDIGHINELTAQYFCEVFEMEAEECTLKNLIGLR